MEEGCDEDYKGEFEDWVRADDGVFAEGFRPEDVGFAKDAAEEPSYYAEEDEN